MGTKKSDSADGRADEAEVDVNAEENSSNHSIFAPDDDAGEPSAPDAEILAALNESDSSDSDVEDDIPSEEDPVDTTDDLDETIEALEHSEDPIELAEPDSQPYDEITEPLPDNPDTFEEAPAQASEHIGEYEEEAGSSFASRALKFLVLLLAGSALGIWAAPKIAGSLPAGMAPVAAWLAPGSGASDAELDEFSQRFEGDLASVNSRLDEIYSEADIQSQITEAVELALVSAAAETSGEIDGIRSSLAELGGPETRQRISRLESSIEGQITELGALKDQLTGGIAASTDQSSEAVKQIDVYRAELEGMRAEMGTLSDSVSALAGRIDEVAATADRTIEQAQAKVTLIETEAATALDAASAEADVATIAAALSASQPFQDAADRLSGGGIDVPEGLVAAAGSSVPTILMLRESFPAAAQNAIKASITASAGDSFIARSKAFLSSQVATRSLSPTEGMNPDAVLSRMEENLRNNDLTGALAESELLATETAAAMSAWLEDARLREAADAGLAELSNSLSATN